MRSQPQEIKGIMRYAIKVNQSEGDPNVSLLAMDFIRALLDEGHGVVRVFFYHDGILAGYSSQVSEWTKLADRGCFDLILCSQAIDARGLESKPERPFVIGGLALWVDAFLKADRVVSFGVPSYAI